MSQKRNASVPADAPSPVAPPAESPAADAPDEGVQSPAQPADAADASASSSEPAAPPAEPLVKAFVLCDCQFGKATDVVNLPENVAKSGAAIGVLDLAPEAIAAAEAK